MKNRKRAIIVGSSMAGLWAARVCVNHFEEVLILERDQISEHPKHRRGVPQDHQLHLLLAQGYNALKEYFPEVIPELVSQGAILGDLGKMLLWHTEGNYRPNCWSGLQTIMMSRPLLETTIRNSLLQRKNIKLLDGIKISGMEIKDNKVCGIRAKGKTWYGDLLIDARGLASNLTTELEKKGYDLPEIEKVQVNVKYTSCLFPREDKFKTLININTKAPFNSKHGTLQPIERERMILMVQGRDHDETPKDAESLIEYTRHLESPEIYEVVKDLTPLTEIRHYGIPFVRWIHYERMNRFPEGLIPLGDSICRLNPVYAQGMSSASIQAQILDRLLSQTNRKSIWKPYLRRVAKAIKTPWELTVTEDFKFPDTKGIPPKLPAFLVTYFDRLNRAANFDPVVYRAFLKVLNMISKPTILFLPNILWRVWRLRGSMQ